MKKARVLLLICLLLCCFTLVFSGCDTIKAIINPEPVEGDEGEETPVTYSLALAAFNVSNVPAGSYEIEYSVANQAELETAAGLTMSFEVKDQTGAKVSVRRGKFDVEADKVYTVVITAQLSNGQTKEKTVTVTAVKTPAVIKWQLFFTSVSELDAVLYAPQSVANGTVPSPVPAPARDGYNFLYWADVATPNAQYSFSTPITKTTTLVAKWELVRYTVTLDTGVEGITAPPVYADITTQYKITSIPTPAYVGHKLDGWFYLVDEEEYPFVVGDTTVPADMTLKAKWSLEKYSIIFYYNKTPIRAEDLSSTIAAREYMSTVTLAELPVFEDVPDGYTFFAWRQVGEASELMDDIVLTANVALEAIVTKITYVVTFDVNAEAPVAPVENQVVSIDTSFRIISPVIATTPVGMELDGWYILPADAQKVDFSTPISEDVHLRAHWKAKQFSYSFYSDGEKIEGSDGTLTYQQQLSSPQGDFSLVKDGYEIVGWGKYATGSNTLTPVVFPYTITENTILHAIWQQITYTVSFMDEDGETELAPDAIATYASGYTVTAPTAPQNEGYTFDGWQDGDEAFDFSTVLSGDKVLTAKWILTQWEVMFNAGDGEFDGAVKNVFVKGSLFGVVPPTAPARAGYTFVGWTVLVNDQPVAFDATAAITAQLSVYAAYEKTLYTVTFNTSLGEFSNGESSIDVTDASIDGVTAPQLSVEGYSLLGWTATQGGTTADYVLSASVVENTSLYAVLEILSFNVTFYNDDALLEALSDVVEYGNDITLSDPSLIKTGYSFNGWYTLDEGGVTMRYFGLEVTSATITADTVFHVDWKLVKHKINIVLLGVTMEEELFVETDVTLNNKVSEAMLTKALADSEAYFTYYAAAWYSDAGKVNALDYTVQYYSTGTVYTEVVATSLEVRVHFDAQAAPVTSMVAENLGTPTSVITTKNYGDTIAIDTELGVIPAVNGYSILGWHYLNSEGESVLIPSGNSITADYIYEIENGTTSVCHVYVLYRLNHFTVTFNSAGGTPDGEQRITSVLLGNKVTSPHAPTREGYSFEGWLDSANQTVDFAVATFTKNTTLTAAWEAVTYTVTLSANGGTFENESSSAQVQGSILGISLPEAPTYPGYSFEGWFADETEYTAASAINDEITLTARWSKVNYQITFLYDDMTEEVKTGTVDGVLFPAAPTVIPDGYYFETWYSEVLEEKVYESTAFTQALTLTPYYETIKRPVEFSYVNASGNVTTMQGYTDVITDYMVELPDVSRNNYVLDGWYEGTGTFGQSSFAYASTSFNFLTQLRPDGSVEPFKLYAKWRPILNNDSIFVTQQYYLDGNGGYVATQTGEYIEIVGINVAVFSDFGIENYQDLVIPAKISNKTVFRIASYAFAARNVSDFTDTATLTAQQQADAYNAIITRLKSFVIKGAPTIMDFAFAYNPSLISITFEAETKLDINWTAFVSDTALINLYVAADLIDEYRTTEDLDTYAEYWAEAGTAGNMRLTVNDVEYLITDSGAVIVGASETASTVNLVIPKVVAYGRNVTAVKSKAFYNFGIRSIVLPETVLELGYNSFCDCSELVSITLLSETPPTIETGSIINCNADLVIYVTDPTRYSGAEWAEYTIMQAQP